MVTLIVVPVVAGFCALFFSKLNVFIGGDHARELILSLHSLKRMTIFSSKNDGLEEDVPGVNKGSANMKDTTDLDKDTNSSSVKEAA